MASIREQLLRRMLIGASVILLAGSVVQGLAIHVRIMDAFDRTLLIKARALAALTSLEGRRVEFEPADPHMPEFGIEEAKEFFQLQLHDGTIFARSQSLKGGALPVTPAPGATPSFRNLRLVDGHRGRLVSFVFSPRVEPENPDEKWLFDLPTAMNPNDVRVTATVARHREDTDLLLASLYLALGIVDALILMAMGLLAYRSIRNGLFPLGALNRQICALDEGDPGRRVRLDATPTELQPVVGALNDLLVRQERALARERQFASDASHELRTPVAELRAACEVGARWPDDPEQTRRFFEDVGAIAGQMERTVANLLTLCRCDRGTVTMRREAVPPAELLRLAGSRLEKQARQRHMTFAYAMDEALRVHTDRDKLGIIIQNLMDNAVSHGDPNTTIRCLAERNPTGIVIAIENHTSLLSPHDLPRVFDRFWRKSASRTDDGHSGLGLSIVKAWCDWLGITIELDFPTPGRIRARLHCPPS